MSKRFTFQHFTLITHISPSQRWGEEDCSMRKYQKDFMFLRDSNWLKFINKMLFEIRMYTQRIHTIRRIQSSDIWFIRHISFNFKFYHIDFAPDRIRHISYNSIYISSHRSRSNITNNFYIFFRNLRLTVSYDKLLSF